MKFWAASLLLVATILLLLAHANGCGVEEPHKKITLKAPPPAAAPEPTPAAPILTPPAPTATATATATSTATSTATDPGPSCGGVPLGETREEACPSGKKIWVCTAKGLVLAVDTCRTQPDDPQTGCAAPTTTTFSAVAPILTRSCKGCHTTYADYDVAKGKIDEFIRRTALPGDQAQHMPRGGELTSGERGEKAILAKWRADGLCPAATPVPNAPSHASLPALESRLLEDLTGVEARLRKNQRYLVGVHAPEEAFETFRQAAIKTMNSLSSERLIQSMTEIDPGIWRIDLDAFGLTATDWHLIEVADKLDLESFTGAGELLKVLSGARKPWFAVDNFDDVSLRQAQTYYAITRIPATFPELTRKLGVHYAQDLADFDAIQAGFVGSPLSPQNRLVTQHKADASGGSLWVTYDTGDNNTDEKNLAQFPLLPDVGGRLNFQMVAGEAIFDLSNGLFGFALFAASQNVNIVQRIGANGRPVLDANGHQIFDRVPRFDLSNRIDAADPTVVHDFANPVSAIISDSVSCFRCHSGGILPFRDQIRDHVLANGSEFGTDKDLILAIYHGNTAPDGVAARIQRSNTSYATALRSMGIDPTQPDPISIVGDRFLTAWNLEKTARFLMFEKPEELKALIDQSAAARSQVGQLAVEGGSITYDQLVASLPVLKIELRLFRDPLAR